jgi:MoxR-like ATPase
MTDALSPELASFTAGSAAARTDEITAESEGVRRVLAEAQRVVVGQDILLERLLLGLLADGHILLEGLPGLAKTLAVKTIATTIEADCRRVQFTPDLLPTDLLGTMIYNQRTSEFTVQRGPIFTNILLADEINRAPAKVQSALLESMQERQVTIGGETIHLPDLFLVLATQNPIEQEGTYPLPEAQLDRFMFNVRVDYPSRDEELEIMRLTTSTSQPLLKPVLDKEEILALQETVRRVPVADPILQYAVRLVRATRLDSPEAPAFVKESLAWGAGPRATQNLILGGKARALLKGRFYVATEDIRAVAHPVLRHRLITNYSAEAEGITSDKLIDRLLETVRPEGGDGGRLPEVLGS